MRNFDGVDVGSRSFALLQFQSIFHRLNFSRVIIKKNSTGIICTTNQILVEWENVDCGEEIVRLVKYSVEFHLCHVDGENVTFGFCGYEEED